METLLESAAPALMIAVAVVIVVAIVVGISARLGQARRRRSFRRVMIRHRVLRELGNVLWGPPRLQDLRDRNDDRG